MWVAWHRDTPAVTGIKAESGGISDADDRALIKLDTEIFRDQGWIDSDESITVDTYRSLTLSEVRIWCEEFQIREPDMYERIIASPDKAMAGRLHVLREADLEVVVALGLQHLPGVLTYLQNPSTIPEEVREVPPVWTLNFPSPDYTSHDGGGTCR